MPVEAWEVAIGERFHMWPADVRRKPADEVWELGAVLGIEAEMARLAEGLGPDEPLFDEGPDDDEDG